MKTMINLSSGIDSVYVAYKWLKDNPKQTLLIHHCSLRTEEKRWKLEDKAVKNVLKWFKDNKLNNFEYIESILDVSFGVALWDSSLMGFMTASLLTNNKYKDITEILNNTPKDEYIRLGRELNNRQVKRDAIFSTVTSKGLTQIPMLSHMMKKEIIEDMPQDLLKLCWYCRKPQGNEVCHKCHTCKQVEGV